MKRCSEERLAGEDEGQNFAQRNVREAERDGGRERRQRPQPETRRTRPTEIEKLPAICVQPAL